MAGTGGGVTRELAIRLQADTLPSWHVAIAPPDLAIWRDGNTGVPGFWRFEAPAPGPHVMLVALVHGNEIAGAVALDQLLRAPPCLLCGRLTVGFANLDAYARFDAAQPTTSRYVDEDMNRLWDAAVLDGPRHSLELARARLMRPLIETADILLDLHSMLWPSEPLILSGPTARGRALACRIGAPAMVVADHGHASGRRLIDYAPFVAAGGARTAVLVEAGQHWQVGTVAAMQGAIAGVLAAAGLIAAPVQRAGPPRLAEVTQAVTACSGGFTFTQPYRGGDVVARRHTLIAMDGDTEVRTPYDDCLLVMPSLRPSRGHTAVRLARFT